MPVEEQLICRRTSERGERAFAEEFAPEHQPRDRDFHVKHIRLELAFDLGTKKISGTSTLTLMPINDGLRSIDLDAVDLAIKAVRGQGKAFPFDHR